MQAGKSSIQFEHPPSYIGGIDRGADGRRRTAGKFFLTGWSWIHAGKEKLGGGGE